MKNILLKTLVFMLVLSFPIFLLCGCNNKEKPDINEFKIEVVNIEYPDITEPQRKTSKVFFKFLYTEEMFEYDLQGYALYLYTSTNGETGKYKDVDVMYGIKYEGYSSVLAFKPNEYIYFTMDFEPGHYELNFKLFDASHSPYKLLKTCNDTVIVNI